MKVFKIYSEGCYYAISGNNEAEAKECLFDEVGEIVIDKVEEIPESEWDEKIIKIYEDNDLDAEPDLTSIREQMFDDYPIMIYTNDRSVFS